MKKRLVILAALAVFCTTPVLAAEPEFTENGDTYEYGHFTVEAIALGANSEEFNENPDYSVYSINDYTEEVPMADSYDANGATSENNTASMYMITTANKAVLIDEGNGAAATASHFGEDSEDEAVLEQINAEYKDLVFSLAGDRELEIWITHNHGDHLGYHDALAGEELTLYFPEEDYTQDIIDYYGDFSEEYNLQLFTPGEMTLTLDDGLTVETILCSGHTTASTMFLLDTPWVTYEYDADGNAVSSSAEYLLFSGDAIGSGSSGWIFSTDGLKTLAASLETVYDKLAGYTNYNDYLSEEEKTDATLKIEGGHGWQITNRFGDMGMDLNYVLSLKTLLEKIPDGEWVEDGYDGKTLEELLQEGYLVTKPIENAFLDTTIYYGTTLTDVAGISTFMDSLKEMAGIPVESEAETETALTPGVMVTADEESTTGYTATFVYEAAEAEEVTVTGAFLFFKDEADVRGTAPETSYSPYEWENGMFEAGDEAYTEEMTKVEGTDYWTVSMPLPCGHYQYVFHVDGSEVKLEDPTNPMEDAGVEAGNAYNRSTFYVPYDAEKQSESIDFSYMAPREDEQSGTVTYVNYSDYYSTQRPLGIYLPYGYDEEREEPYKVLYLSHGGGGNEVDWFAGGSVDYIFDNLIAGGTVEPMIIVTMDNTAYSWNFDVIVKNLMYAIIPYIEDNYNVSGEVSGRAFAGLSMGGMTSSQVLYQQGDEFGYIAIMSGADVGEDFAALDLEKLQQPSIMLGAGIYDFGLVSEASGTADDGFTITGLKAKLDEAGITYGWAEAYGEHDWNTWPQLIKVFAEEYLWK